MDMFQRIVASAMATKMVDPEPVYEPPKKTPWVYLDVPQAIKDTLRDWQRLMDGTLVNNLHITLLHSVLDDAPQNELRLASAALPLDAVLGAVRVFSGTPEGDAVVVEVISDSISEFRATMADRVEHEPSEHPFLPHITLAYVEDGEIYEGLDIHGLTGLDFVAESIVYDDHESEERFAAAAGDGWQSKSVSSGLDSIVEKVVGLTTLEAESGGFLAADDDDEDDEDELTAAELKWLDDGELLFG